MKKLVATISAVITTALMCVLISACSTASFTGTWKFYSTSMSGSGMSIELKVGEEYMGVTLSEDYMVMEVRDDNTLTMTGAGETFEGTWKEEDGKYIITIDGEAQTATINGNELTIEVTEEGMTSKTVLKKA